MARKTEQSRKLQRRAERFIPGGVNSPVRAFRAVGGDPLYIVRGQVRTFGMPMAVSMWTTSAPGDRSSSGTQRPQSSRR